MSEEHVTSRRELLKKAAYIAPVVLTMAVTPSFAATGSGNRGGGSARSSSSSSGTGNSNVKGHARPGKNK